MSLRRLKIVIAAAIAVSSIATATACTTSGQVWAPRAWIEKYFKRDQRDKLVDFKAIDGAYFPGFIKRFFPGAKTFERLYADLPAARQGVLMVEVRKLTDGNDSLNEANLSWSADGVYLGFEIIGVENRRILLKDLMGDFARELMVLPMSDRGSFIEGVAGNVSGNSSSMLSYNAGLRWSRDSNRFAFVSNGGVGEFNIYVGSVAGGEKTVASSRAKNGYASWNPSGNEIAFVSSRKGTAKIYVVEVDEQKVLQVSNSGEPDLFPEWYPDGKRIVFSSGDARNHDVVMTRRNASGSGGGSGQGWSQPFNITKSEADELRPTVSPDGRFIAFYSAVRPKSEDSFDENTHWNIHVVPTDARGFPLSDEALANQLVARDVVVDLNTGPAWTPDARKVIFVKRDPSLFNPIHAYDMYEGKTYFFRTNTKMNRDIMMSKLGVLSFRAQVGAWDKVFVALTNQGVQLQGRALQQLRPVFLQN